MFPWVCTVHQTHSAAHREPLFYSEYIFNVAFHLLLLNRRKATQIPFVNWHLTGDVITIHKLIRELVETKTLKK